MDIFCCCYCDDSYREVLGRYSSGRTEASTVSDLGKLPLLLHTTTYPPSPPSSSIGIKDDCNDSSSIRRFTHLIAVGTHSNTIVILRDETSTAEESGLTVVQTLSSDVIHDVPERYFVIHESKAFINCTIEYLKTYFLIYFGVIVYYFEFASVQYGEYRVKVTNDEIASYF